MSNYKLIKKIMIVLLLLVIIWAIIWGINYLQYQKFSSGYEDYGLCLGKSSDDYQYSLKYPTFVSLTGNFAINNKDDTIGIIIWPKPFLRGDFKEYKVGLRIFDTDINQGYLFYVDSHMEYLPQENNSFSDKEEESIRSFLKANTYEINKMYSEAQKEWGSVD